MRILTLLIAHIVVCVAAVAQTPFVPVRIPAEVRQRITGKSFPSTPCKITLDDLRYIPILHINGEGEVQQGEIIVNKSIANDVAEIFRTLYEARYPIESVRLIDDFDASDEKSMRANNSSAFCYRAMTGQKALSKHALGLAIDINPLYNPYFKVTRNAAGDSIGYFHLEPATATPYVDRSKDFKYRITANDFIVTLFKKYGFTWGGDWTTIKDYQHFQR